MLEKHFGIHPEAKSWHLGILSDIAQFKIFSDIEFIVKSAMC